MTAKRSEVFERLQVEMEHQTSLTDFGKKRWRIRPAEQVKTRRCGSKIEQPCKRRYAH